ncbi:MAG: dTMP kinase [Candidatus Solibacter sp.]|nr:dTMP kinase [Candidatus Solibacter sp.]
MSITRLDPAAERKFRELLRSQEKNRGFLIAFEGPDGAGKTTQRKLFKAWMRSVGHEVVTYRWNSSPVISPILKARKLAHSLSPEEYCILSAAAFRHQLDTEILPALWSGKVVVADRFLFTALARDTARGLDLHWVMNAYLPLFWPDQVYYFALPAEVSSQRISSNKKPSFYEAGQDVTNMADPVASHKQFVGRVIQEYEALSKIFQFLRVDARQSIYEQHRAIRQIFMQGDRKSWAEWNMDAVVSWLSGTTVTPNVETGKEE